MKCLTLSNKGDLTNIWVWNWESYVRVTRKDVPRRVGSTLEVWQSWSVLPVFAATLSRRKWPLDKYSKPKVRAILWDIVPFPDPGGPMIAARNSLAILVETRLQLLKNKQTQKRKTLECPTVAALVFWAFCFFFFNSNVFSFRHARWKLAQVWICALKHL